VKPLGGKKCREKMEENPEDSKNVKRRMKEERNGGNGLEQYGIFFSND